MDLMARRSLLMMQAELPAIYQKVEYLKGAGSQYLLLNNGFATNIDYELVCQSDDTSSVQVIVGQSAKSGYWFGTFNRAYSLGVYTFNNVNIADKVTCILNYGSTNCKATIGDKVINGSAYDGSPRGLTLFGAQGSSSYTYSTVKIFSFKSDGVINLIPCIRKSDSKPGMYDTVTKTFFTNQGTGEFIIPT